MAQAKLSEEGIKRLVIAVCRQWVDDNKPKAGKETVEYYAELMRQCGMIKTYEYYKQGILHTPGGNDDTVSD
jgi:hypothetical protein